MGSIGGGGRYDGLIGMFSGKPIPAVGVSIGVERLFLIYEEKLKQTNKNFRHNDTQVLVATIGDNMVQHKLKICNELWQDDIKSEYIYNVHPKPKK